jgi:hypothetical protein
VKSLPQLVSRDPKRPTESYVYFATHRLGIKSTVAKSRRKTPARFHNACANLELVHGRLARTWYNQLGGQRPNLRCRRSWQRAWWARRCRVLVARPKRVGADPRGWPQVDGSHRRNRCTGLRERQRPHQVRHPRGVRPHHVQPGERAVPRRLDLGRLHVARQDGGRVLVHQLGDLLSSS